MEGYHLPRLLQSNQPSHDWRPQTCKEKDAARGRKQVLCDGDRFRRFRSKTGDPEVDQSDAEATPEEKQANTGPAIRKS
jgi:hypothetical protein